MSITEKQREVSIDTVSQAIELGAKVVMEVAGKSAANHLGGELVTDEQLKEMLAANLQTAMMKSRLGGGQ